MNFRIRGLEARQFDHLFALSDGTMLSKLLVRERKKMIELPRLKTADAKIHE